MDRSELERILSDHRRWYEESCHKGERAYLPGVNLQGADLQGVLLCGATLRGANLQGANLQGADLQSTNLRGANLQGANLQGVNLKWACAKGANLKCADMRGANLIETDLIEVRLSGAIMPLDIRNCLNFRRATISADALPWLILHPRWSEFKSTVKIVEGGKLCTRHTMRDTFVA